VVGSGKSVHTAGFDLAGVNLHRLVNWFATPPRIKEGYVRDERTQAAYLAELTS
jgi:hypothetical protein